MCLNKQWKAARLVSSSCHPCVSFSWQIRYHEWLLICALRISLLTGSWKLLRFLHSLVPLAFILQLQSFEVPASLVTDVLFKGLCTKVKRKSILGQRKVDYVIYNYFFLTKTWSSGDVLRPTVDIQRLKLTKYRWHSQYLYFRAELTPTLQTTCMLDCLATIKTTISYLQKLRAEDSLPHVFDQLTFSSFKNQTIADQKACNNVADSKAVKPLTDLLMDLLLDLSSLMCDGM